MMKLNAGNLGLAKLGYLAYGKMAARRYISSTLLLNRRKRQLSEDFSFRRPLTSKYVLLNQSHSIMPVLASCFLAKSGKTAKREPMDDPFCHLMTRHV